MFAKPFAAELKDAVEFVGLYDVNQIRARTLSEECGNVPVFQDFRTMMETARPDTVVVASTDATHHEYIIAGLDTGCDVVTEKPMTTDGDKCRAILAAERRSGRKLTVTFNLRFVPYMARVKELLRQGVIGQVQHASVDWFLDRSHGADYFRRWHSQLEHSGGLLVHKSTHHFDIVNWWMDATPELVHAFGRLAFYGPNREARGSRCLTCAHKQACELYFDLERNDLHNRYYLQAEGEDGYIRDKCVFRDEIDIYDTMSVQVRYQNGAQLSYSLVAYSPEEGWKMTLTGTEGRMEVAAMHSGPLSKGVHSERIRIIKPNGETVSYDIPVSGGGHGGGDERLLDMIFRGGIPDPLGQHAGSTAGAMSLLIGAAANVSIAEGRVVTIQELLGGNKI